MMQQLNIEYFFPLTEQIPLELDYSECENPKIYWNTEVLGTSGQFLINGGTGATAWTTLSTNIGSPSFTINVDAMPITIISKKKPNFIMKFIYKSMGMKWKAE
jgi:hypothetical protein